MSLQTIYESAKADRKDNFKFVKIEEGEIFKGEFVGVNDIINNFGQECHEYKFNTENGEKLFQNGSFRLLQAMMTAGVEEGDIIEISKTGDKFETQYFVKKILGKDGLVGMKEDEEKEKAEAVDPKNVPF